MRYPEQDTHQPTVLLRRPESGWQQVDGGSHQTPTHHLEHTTYSQILTQNHRHVVSLYSHSMWYLNLVTYRSQYSTSRSRTQVGTVGTYSRMATSQPLVCSTPLGTIPPYGVDLSTRKCLRSLWYWVLLTVVSLYC